MEINGKNYVVGMFRGDNGENMATHLYQGTHGNPGNPMCSRGWQRVWYDKDGKVEHYEYSIFRGNVSEPGICKVCMRRAIAGLEPIAKPRNRKPKKDFINS